MTRPTQTALATLVPDLLVEGPLTGFEITRRLEESFPLRGREGSLYAILLDLEQRGYIESVEEPREDGETRRRYRLPVLRDLRGGGE
jgi:PadR family transcriptional regulator PadR